MADTSLAKENTLGLVELDSSGGWQQEETPLEELLAKVTRALETATTLQDYYSLSGACRVCVNRLRGDPGLAARLGAFLVLLRSCEKLPSTGNPVRRETLGLVELSEDGGLRRVETPTPEMYGRVMGALRGATTADEFFALAAACRALRNRLASRSMPGELEEFRLLFRTQYNGLVGGGETPELDVASQ